MMKKGKGKICSLFWLILVLISTGPVFGQEVLAQKNNDFYDNEPFKALPISSLEIAGEVEAAGWYKLVDLPLHQVIVREARKIGDKSIFIGAYVYQGYSLFDVLKNQILNKKNKEEFSSPIDLLVIIQNKKGEKAIFSWGEIFYPSVLHRLIIATRVAPIIPSLTGESWPLPEACKIVAANDLISERNLEEPIKITVQSCPINYPVIKSKKPLFSDKVKIIYRDKEITSINSLPKDINTITLPSVFFGRGRGFHGLREFKGIPLRQLIGKYLPIDILNQKDTYLLFVADDGYRAVFSAAEIFNRNDGAEVLLCQLGQAEGGRFSLYPSFDFFSDRAVKALKEIHILKIDN
ncbi:MAG: hypothetical protein ACPLZD_00050 [Candidatus Saccharicenans sp.]